MTAYFSKKWEQKKLQQKRVVITGYGAVTPLGNNIQTTWDNLIKGNSGIGPITLFDAANYPVKIAAEVKNFNFEYAASVRRTRPVFRPQHPVLRQRGTRGSAQGRSQLENRETGNIGISLGANEEYAHFSQYDRMFVPEKII